MVGPAQSAPVSRQGTWETSLQRRDLDGNGSIDAVYDTHLNITWLRQANVNGTMNWGDANAWAASYSIGAYGDWRLPTVTGAGLSECIIGYGGGTTCGYNVDAGSSEMAHLNYVTLGNKAFCDPTTSTMTSCYGPQLGWGLTNTGDFENMQSAYYWAGTEILPNTSNAWTFVIYDGAQGVVDKGNTFYAMAVHDGDIGTPVPEPGTLALLALGLAGLGYSRRKQ